MKVLMLSTDANILTQGSSAHERMLEYAKLFEELHIVVYEKAKSEKRKAKNNKNLYLYPTNSNFRLAYFWQAYKLGCHIIRNWELEIRNYAITTQDPFETVLVGVLLKNKFTIPLQVQCHVDFLNKYFWRESFKNKFRTLLAKFVLRQADGIRVVSERIAEALINHLALPIAKIIVLPIFVDFKKSINAPIKTDLHKKYPDYDFIILMASRLSHEKNIELAIASMKEVVLKYPRALLLIVGEGSEKNNLEIDIKKFSLENNIAIEPWTSDLASYCKTADLFLLTSNYEGYGRTIIEALVAGLSIVTTNVGIVEKFVSNSLGLIVPVGDKVALTDAILKMIKRKISGNLRVSGGVIKDMLSHEEYLRLYKESFSNLLNKYKRYATDVISRD